MVIEPWESIEVAPEKAAGCDEAGRGPLAGNVIAAAVILDPREPITGLADSKKLSHKQRESLYETILSKALGVGIGSASPQEIDEINILQASLLAMTRAVDALPTKPEFVFVDGNRCPRWSIPSLAVVKGDAKVASISAASIVAKVVRDRELQLLDEQYPDYGFAQHKGYPTAAHFTALERFGVTPVHRLSFAPVAARIKRS
ncbi:MAG: ribonuclease HII [Pseudohongiellaceae bacterium]